MNKSIYTAISAVSLRLAPWVFATSIFYTLFSLSSYAIFEESLPAFFLIPRMRPLFADLAQLTHSSGCSYAFSDLLANKANCDPLSRPFNYTYLSLTLFRKLQIDATDTQLIGLFIGIFAIIACIYFIFNTSGSGRTALLISALFIFSFPFQLALERGNYDLVILILSLFIAPALFSKLRFISPVLAFGACGLKIFPALGLVPWSTILLCSNETFSPNLKNIRFILYLMLLAAILGISFQFQDIFSILANTPKPDGGISFGLLASYQARIGFKLAGAITVAKLIVLALSARWAFVEFNSHEDFYESISGDKSCQSASLFGIMTILIYFASCSYDYRLIFCIGFLPAVLNAVHRLGIAGGRYLILLSSDWLFILYEQYAPGCLGEALHILSDIIVQPIAVGILSAFVFIICRPKLNFPLGKTLGESRKLLNPTVVRHS